MQEIERAPGMIYGFLAKASDARRKMFTRIFWALCIAGLSSVLSATLITWYLLGHQTGVGIAVELNPLYRSYGPLLFYPFVVMLNGAVYLALWRAPVKVIFKIFAGVAYEAANILDFLHDFTLYVNRFLVSGFYVFPTGVYMTLNASLFFSVEEALLSIGFSLTILACAVGLLKWTETREAFHISLFREKGGKLPGCLEKRISRQSALCANLRTDRPRKLNQR